MPLCSRLRLHLHVASMLPLLNCTKRFLPTQGLLMYLEQEANYTMLREVAGEHTLHTTRCVVT